MKIGPLNRRALGAVGLLLALVLALLFAGQAITTAIYTENLVVGARKAELATLQRRLKLLHNSEAGSGAAAFEPFLEGPTLSLAANTLQQRLTSLIDTQEATLLSIGIDPPNPGEESKLVRVQATAEMDITALQAVLYQLESEIPFVFVDSLVVERVGPQQSAGSDSDEAEDKLRVELRVSGYWRGQ